MLLKGAYLAIFDHWVPQFTPQGVVVDRDRGGAQHGPDPLGKRLDLLGLDVSRVRWEPDVQHCFVGVLSAVGDVDV